MMTPMQAAANRTARLVREAATPVFVSTREGQAARERADLLRRAEEYTCRDDDQPWCFVCSRPTNHFGEHDDDQLLKFANSPLGRRLMR